MHPSNEIRGTKDSALSGKRIVLGVTGSIAAVETVKLARELIRRGAEVYPVMTQAATRIIHPDSLYFATGHRTMTELTGAVEHVQLCGDVEGHADLLLIAPSTANTISKIACGIDDTPVTTFATTAMGTGIPIMIVPAMHATMYGNQAVIRNVERLKRLGVEFVGPRFEEKKAKMADTDEIVSRVVRRIGKGDMRGKKILVIAGATGESIDEMRVVTNRSTGWTGVEIALEAFERGADVDLWLGRNRVHVPAWINTGGFSTVTSLLKKVEESMMDYHAVIVPAAISDYIPERQEGKIPSGMPELIVRFKPAEKVIEHIRRRFDGILVAFKLETVEDTEELIRRAEKRASQYRIDLMVANRLSDVGRKKTRAYLIKENEVKGFEGTKRELAREILDIISGYFD